MNIMLAAIAGVSLVLAAAASAVTWRVLRDERRRSNARVATLAAALAEEVVAPARQAVDGPDAGMFGSVQPPISRTMAGATAGAGALVVGLVVAGTVLFSSWSKPSVATGLSPAGATRAAPADRLEPLELVALEHDRTVNRLTVRGIVRNPIGGPVRRNVAAVVLLFGEDGAFVASGRAQTAHDSLPAGGETTFEVVITDARDVERYRVSFRADAAIIPHVDRRTAGGTI